MCLYIITQLTGAALHTTTERGSVKHFIPGRAHDHAAHGTLYTQFKKHSRLLPLFSKADS